jgi:hypothetical protein
MTYRPRLVRQGDGSRWQWTNCTMASAAIAIDRHTLGRIRTTGAKMRSCQNDKIGGTDMMDCRLAWDRCFNQNLDVRLKITWKTFIGAIKAGRGVIVVGNYSYIPYQYRGQKHPYRFGHGMYINEVRASDGALLVYDPLGTRPVWIPQIHIKRYAGAFKTTRGTLGYGYVQAGFTRITSATAPKPVPSVVKLRFGGIKITPNLYEAKVAAKQRRSPYIRTDNIIQTVAIGTDFRAYQKTIKGTNVGGSSTWYGNISGTVWMHSSVLRDI